MDKKMRIFLSLILLLALSACIEAGEFSPERHALHEYGHPDCQVEPQKCVNGVAW